MSTRCHATTTAGAPCKRWAIAHGTVCPAHGGSAPQVKAAARKREIVAQAQAVVATYEHEPLESPDLELLAVASEFLALKSELGRRSAELSTLTATDRHGAEQISAILGAYQASLAQVADVLVKINRLGLENRRVQVVEADYRKLVQGVQSGLYAGAAQCDPPLSHENTQLILRTIGEHVLRIYEGGE
jgi:hypothetical protein